MTLVLVSTSNASNNLTSGGAVTVNKPTSVSSGNLLVAQVTAGNGGNTFTTTGGWTTYKTISSVSGSPQYTLYWKVATGSEPSSYVFTPATTTDACHAGIYNITGADTTTPFNGDFTNSSSAAAVTAGSTTGTASIPTIIGCLPIAFFSIDQENLSNSGQPTGLTSGWTANYFNVLQDSSNYGNTSNGNGYNATFAASGPLTSDTSTAITASCTWQGSFSTLNGIETIVFINPFTTGPVVISPSTISIPSAGQTTTATVSQANSTATITLSSSNTSVFTVSPTTVTAPGPVTITLTGVTSGTNATLTANSPV